MTKPPEAEIGANAKRARASLDAAQTLLGAGHYDFAASRAYYAAFYAATAALMAQGLEFNRHSAVMSAVHREFVKTGRLSKQHGKALNQLFELRSIGDYGQARHVPREEARGAIVAAGGLVDALLAII